MSNYTMCPKGYVALLLLYTIAGTMLFQVVNAGTEDIVKAGNQVSVSIISKEMNYHEYGDGRLGTKVGLLDSENGRMSGFKLGLSLMSDKYFGVHHLLTASISAPSGNMTYTGQSLSAVSMPGTEGYGSVKFSHGNTALNYDAAYGFGFDFTDSLMIGPIAEFGYRSWYRNINNGETYTNNYVAYGIFFKYSPITKWVFSGTATFGHTQSSAIEVTPMQTYGGFSGTLGNSSTERFSLSADYAFTNKIHGHAGIESARFSYGASETYPTSQNYVMWEPSSTTVEIVTGVGLGYVF